MTHTRLPSTAPWLLPSFALGCLCAWLWISADRTAVFLSGDWTLSYLGPAVLAALVFPLLGAVADLRRAAGLATGLAGAACLLLLLFAGADGPAENRLVPPLVITLLATTLFHLGALPLFPGAARKGLPGLGLAVTLATGVLVSLTATHLWPLLPWRGLLLTAAGLALLLFTAVIWEREGKGVVPDWPDVMEALRGYPGAHPGFRDVVGLLVFMLLTASGVAQLQFTVWARMEHGSFPVGPAEFPLAFPLLVVAGALAGRGLADTFGNRRLLLMSSLLSALLVLGLFLSTHHLEVALMVGSLAVSAGVIWGVIVSLLVRMTPRDLCGQTFGYALTCLVFGVLLGKLLQLAYRGTVPPLGNMLVFLGAMAVSLGISPNRAVRAMDGDTSEENPRDIEWDWLEAPAQGLARHTLVSSFSRILARGLCELFFGRFRILGRENLQGGHGVIYLANHPNTFFDPLLVTAIVPGRLHYWAKSTLWRMPLAGSILDRLGAIPVYRRQDGDGGQNAGNQKTMQVAADKLNQGAHMLIFPEGVSQVGLSLKPIKTGAARLAFAAMEARDWQPDVAIVPIGIDYEEPALFRGGVTVRIGEPVSAADFREAWAADQRDAVRTVTAEVTSRMTALLPHLEEPELETLVHRIQALYGERLLQIMDEHDETAARKAIAEAVNHYQHMDPDTVYLFNLRLEAYHQERERLATPENHPPIPVRELLRMLLGMVSLASFGLVTNWLPYRLTGRIVALFGASPVWTATLKVAVGGLLFGLYYLVLGTVLTLTLGPLAAGVILALVVFSAFTALGALDRFAFRTAQLKTLWQAFWTQDTDEDLDQMRTSLIQDLERFRESYAFYLAREQDL